MVRGEPTGHAHRLRARLGRLCAGPRGGQRSRLAAADAPPRSLPAPPSPGPAKCGVELTAFVLYEGADQAQLAALLPRTLASVTGFVLDACVCAPACAFCGLPALESSSWLPTRMVHRASPELCLAACVTRDGAARGALLYAVPLLVGEVLEVTVAGLEAAHAGVPLEQPQAAATVTAVVERVLAAQGWPDAIMLTHAATLEAPDSARPALLYGGAPWELDKTRAWRTPKRIVRDARNINQWPGYETVNFRVLSRQASEDRLDAHAAEDRLLGELGAAGGDDASRARTLYQLGRAQELLGKSMAASKTFDAVVELRGRGAADEHVHHAYLSTGRERAARGGLEQGLLRFLAAYEMLPERGVEALVEAAVACRQSNKASNLARLFAFAAAAENQARLQDGLSIPAGANPAAYDHLADVEAFFSSVRSSAQSVVRAGVAAGVRLLRNDAAPRFLWRVWHYNVVTIVGRLRLRADAVMLESQISEVFDALASEIPRCVVEEVLLGAAEGQHGCPALAGLLSTRVMIVESSARAAAQLALSLGCDSYSRVRVPALLMPAELREGLATGQSGQQARRAFAHVCALAHVASNFSGETLPVAILQDDAPAPAPVRLATVVDRLASMTHCGSNSSRGACITLLAGASLTDSMHAYAVSVVAAERITHLLPGFDKHGFPAAAASAASESLDVRLVQDPLEVLLAPLTASGRLSIRAAAELPFAARNTLELDNAGVNDELVLACAAGGDTSDDEVCKGHWLVPVLLRNATGLRVRLVSEAEAAKAHAVLLLYSDDRAEALDRARLLSRSAPLVIAQSLQLFGRLDILTTAGQSVALPSLSRWLQAAVVLRHPKSALDGIDLHPGLLAQQHAAWLRRPATAVHLWLHDDASLQTHESKLEVFSDAGIALNVIGPVPRQYVAATPSPQEKTKARVVVTLTSIPPRIHFLPHVIAALLNQTHAPDAIYVTLPRTWARGNAAHSEEPALQLMEQQLTLLDRRIVVKRPEVDLGPVMKLLPALEAEQARAAALKESSEVLVLYLDDDWVLPPGFVHAFVAAAARAPGSVIYRSCGINLHDVARRDMHTFQLGCSLPEAFAGVLLPLTALRAAFPDGSLSSIISRAVAHPACLRGDDYVLGELYIRAGIRSAPMPLDLQNSLGRSISATTYSAGYDDGAVALNGGVDGLYPRRYNGCAQHLRELLDALLPLRPHPRAVLPLPPPLPLSQASPVVDAFASHRFAVVRDSEQAVQALAVGTVPVLFRCPAERDDLEARVLAANRMLCIGSRRRASFALRRLSLNASAQLAFFARPVVGPAALEAVHAALADVALALRGGIQQQCDAESGADPRFAAVVCASLAGSARPSLDL